MFLKSEIDLFKKLSQIDGVSGQEHYVAKFLKEQYENLGYEIVTDNLGCIYAHKKSLIENAKKVIIDAHMDEIGLICVGVDKKGLISVSPIGGIYEEAFFASRVELITKNGRKLFGTCDISIANKDMNIKKMKFDFGFSNDQEAYENGVYIGAMIVASGDLQILNNGQRLMSKAFDDRYGLVLGLEILKYFKNKQLPYDLYVGGSVQEEVGLRGAATAANLIKPDLAIVLDCSPARETIGDQGSLGQGVLIRYFDRSMIANPRLLSLQEKACQKSKVKYQYFQSTGGTNAGKFHLSNNGTLTLTHCICARNLHTQSSIIDADDYQAAKKSLIALLKMLNNEKIEKLKVK